MTVESRDKEIFDKIAHKYAKKDIVKSSSIARKHQLLLAIRPLLRKNNSLGTVVDIGCGAGQAARYLQTHYERYIGIDQSEPMIEAARTLNKNEDNVIFLSENVKSCTLNDNTADLILSIGALHHFTELDRALFSIKRIAKPGSGFLAIEPQNANPLVQAARGLRKLLDTSYSKDQICFSERSIRDLLSRHSMAVTEIDYQGFISAVFAQVIFNPQILFSKISSCSTKIDEWITGHMPRNLRKLSFNIVIYARFNK